jgi:hypothetical protein
LSHRADPEAIERGLPGGDSHSPEPWLVREELADR